jgi:hypothetical protein
MFYSAPPIYWAAIEMNLAIVCACVPALKPLVVKLAPAFSSRRSGNGSSQQSGGSKITQSFRRFGTSNASVGKSVDVEQGHMGMDLGAITALPHVHRKYSQNEHIRVTHEFDQKSDRRPSDGSSQRLVLQGTYAKI